jgi:hypothetical protein
MRAQWRFRGGKLFGASPLGLGGADFLAVCVARAQQAARSRWPISEMVEALANERRRLAAPAAVVAAVLGRAAGGGPVQRPGAAAGPQRSPSRTEV